MPVTGNPDTSDGPAYPMRGESISYEDTSANSAPFERGVPWEDGYFDLKYRDYVNSDEESYAMRMRVGTSVRQALGVPSDEDVAVIEVYEAIEGGEEELVADYTVKSNISDEAATVIDSLDIPPPEFGDEGLPVRLFSHLISGKLKDYGASNVGELEGTLQDQWGYLCDVYMRKFTLLMASNKDKTLDPPPNSFQFGYDTSQQVEKVFMGGEELDETFFDNNREYFRKTVDGELVEASYEEATDPAEDMGPIIQSEILNRFGGTFKNPTWYERNPERDGWLGMTDRLVPDPDGCDPLDGSEPREPICKFEDLKDVYSDLLNKYQDDKRLFMRPGAHCADPQPFNAIFNRGGAAGVDSTIIAMIRIYVIEAMLRGTAIFSVYGEDCYDEILSTYIIKYMDDDLANMGVWGLPSKKFYYFFMEQIVQMYGRQVDLGMIEPTSDEQDALNRLNEYQLNNQIRVRGGFAKAVYNRELGEIVQEALDLEEEGRWTAGIRTLLSHFVLKEIKAMFKQFGESVYPDGAPVANIHSILFNSPAFIRGSVESGIPDVWNGLEGDESNVYEQDLIADYESPIDETSVYPYLASVLGNSGIGNHPFRLEKYISFQGYPDDIDDHLKGVVSIDAFNDWAFGQGDKLPLPMSESFSGGRLGFRLVFTTSASERGDAEWGGDDNVGSFIDEFASSIDD